VQKRLRRHSSRAHIQNRTTETETNKAIQIMNKFLPVQNGFEWLDNIDNEVDPPLPPPLFAPRKRTGSLSFENKNSSVERQHEHPSSSSSPSLLAAEYRSRSTSDAMPEGTDDPNFLDLITTNLLTFRMTELLVELLARLLPPLKLRSFYFTVVLVILSLVLFGQASQRLSMHGVSPQGWYTFTLEVMATDLATCIVDELLFLLIDRLWYGAEEVRLYAHCLNGPLSFILTLSIVNGVLSTEEVPASISQWNPLMSALITIWTFYTIRRFYLRMNLNKLMVARFSRRIHEMQLDTKVLSILSHAVPRRSTHHEIHSRYMDETTSSSSNNSNRTSSATIRPSFDSSPPATSSGNQQPQHPCRDRPFAPELASLPEHQQSPLPPQPSPLRRPSGEKKEDTEEPQAHSLAIDKLKSSSFSTHFSQFIHKHRQQRASRRGEDASGEGESPMASATDKLSFTDIFSEIVESSHRKGEQNLSADDYGIQQSFWSQLAEVSHGSLVIHTTNGPLIIRTKKHAVSFGKRLFTLLSRGGHKKITSQRLTELIERHHREKSVGANTSAGTGGTTSDDADLKEILTRAQELFHLPTELDPDYTSTAVTLPMMNDICISVYRSRRNIASSLSDFGELRKSLIAVADVLFWIAMVVVAQMILKIDLESVFAPVLTLIFAISFALGPMVSNVFVAIGYVSFMLPYDVGDRVAIGYGPTKIVGNIARITLLQTTITTIYNERVG
jgi:hypothetical protein